MSDIENVIHSYSYFPILIDDKVYGMNRDELYEKLKENNIFARKYFYPLISDFEPYHELPTATSENLQIATKVAKQVLCLPIYVELSKLDIVRICLILKKEK